MVYTPHNLADFVGVHYVTVVRWIEEGKIKPTYVHKFKDTNRYYFSAKDIEKVRSWHNSKEYYGDSYFHKSGDLPSRPGRG